MLGRGWSPSRRIRTAGYLCVGLLLVFNPVYLVPLGVGGPTYQYEAVPVEIHDGGFELHDPDSFTSLGDIRGLDCYTFSGGRRCYFDYLLSERGDRTVSERIVGGEYRAAKPYVVIKGRIFRRTAEQVNDSAIRFGLTQVRAERALSDIAIPIEQADRPIERAVRTGDVTTNQVYEDQFVHGDDGYYLVTIRGTAPVRQPRRPVGNWIGHAVGVAIGLGLFVRGERLRRGS